jgi:PKD domain/Putative Ig domain
LEEVIREKQGFPRLQLYALFGLAFFGVVVCCYVLIMMGTAFISLGSIASASPQDEEETFVLAKNLPSGCDTSLDTTLFTGLEGDPGTYEWYGPFPPASGPNPDLFLPEGTHAISLLTNDGRQRSGPLTCYIRVEPAVPFDLHAKRGKVVLDLPLREEAQRIDIYRASAADPSALKRIARLPSGTMTYVDNAVSEEIYLYTISVLSGGQWSFSRVRAARPYSMLPRWNYPPVICSKPVDSGRVGLPYTYDVMAVDPQEDELTYSLDNPQEGMLIDARTGLIEWIPRGAGDYETTVKVTDSKGYSSYQAFTIEVEDLSDPNRMPVVHAGGPYKAEIGQLVAFNGSGSYDPDGSKLSHEWYFGDGRYDTGLFPTHAYTSPGTYQVVLTVTDGKGGIASTSTTVTVHECFAPTMSLSVDPAAVQPGEPCSLSWSSEKADSLSMDHGIGPVGASGSLMIYPEKTVTITMTADGRCGSAAIAATAMVYEPPVLDVSVSEGVIRKGETTSLSWTSANADTVTIDQGIGVVMPDGMLSLSPIYSKSYTVTAKGPGGSLTKSIPIHVLPGILVSIDASAKSITAGQTATLSWTSSDAESIIIDQGVGPVSASGSLEVFPRSTTTYTITAHNPWGTATDTVTLVVHPPPEVHLYADPIEVEQGQSCVIAWTSEHAFAATLDHGIGKVDTQGILEISPSETTTYTLTAQGEGGYITASVTVSVVVKPEVTMAAFPDTIDAGGSCTLTWITTNALGATLDNGIGPVPLEGSIEVRPSMTTTYTLTAVDSSGRSASVQATVTVQQLLPDTSPDPPEHGPGRAPP